MFLKKRSFSAFLFDMDGTLLTSISAAERVWGRWAASKGIDPDEFLPTIHGRRARDTIAGLNLPNLDVDVEAARVTAAEIEDVEGVVAIAGAAEFLASLPEDRWAIVTSATRELACRRLDAAGLKKPRHMVTGEDVLVGKPDPHCFLLGAQRLGLSAVQCLVFEDVPAGVAAGKAAGAEVLAITSANREATVFDVPTICDYNSITLSVHANDDMSIRLREAVN